MTFEKRLKEMALFGIGKRRLAVRCNNNNPVFKGLFKKKGCNLFSKTLTNRL